MKLHLPNDRPAENTRELLTELGIGQWNATMIIPYMMVAPATTDPKSPHTLMLVSQIQKILYQMGATDVPLSGELDVPTARALAQITGPDWERTSWGGNVAAILTARRSGRRLSPPIKDGMPVAVGGPLDFLPDVPGGLLTYAIAGYFLYRHLRRRA